MNYTMLPDNTIEEGAVLTDKAFRLHLEALLYSAKHELDGRIRIKTLMSLTHCKRSKEALRELLSEGVIEMYGEEHIVVRLHQDIQWTAEMHRAKRKDAALRKQKQRKAKAGSALADGWVLPTGYVQEGAPAQAADLRVHASVTRDLQATHRLRVPTTSGDVPCDLGKDRLGEEGMSADFPFKRLSGPISPPQPEHEDGWPTVVLHSNRRIEAAVVASTAADLRPDPAIDASTRDATSWADPLYMREN